MIHVWVVVSVRRNVPIMQSGSRGRYRGDLDILYLFDRDTDEPLIVPDEFLDIQLFEEHKRKLRLYFSIKDKKGHYLSL